MRRAVRAAAIVALASVALAGCAQDELAEQYRAGSGKQYIAGDSSVTEISPEDRGDPVEFSVTTAEGDTVTSDDYRGRVLVVNFWYASCAPCRAEAPDLATISQEMPADDVAFLGANVRDGKETAEAFNKEFGIEYPSVLDTQDRSGGLLMAFSGEAAPNAVPTTLIVDRDGRVASRVLGEFDPSILRTLINDTVAESESSAG